MPVIGTRITTREAAKILGCRPSQCVHLLRAAGINSAKAGAAHLWDQGAVRMLADTLKNTPKTSAAAVAQSRNRKNVTHGKS